MLHAVGVRGLSRGGFFCASPPKFKKLVNSAVGCWKGWLPRTLAGEPFSKRLFGTDGSGRVSSDNPADKPEPVIERDAGAEHLRTCWIDTDETSSHFKTWRNVVLESSQETFSDSVVSGRATALTVCRKMLQNGSDPKRWFAEWGKELSIGCEDRARHEMYALTDIFYQAGSDDQLNVGALASLELVSRRPPQCNETCAHGADAPIWASAKHFCGSS